MSYQQPRHPIALPWWQGLSCCGLKQIPPGLHWLLHSCLGQEPQTEMLWMRREQMRALACQTLHALWRLLKPAWAQMLFACGLQDPAA